MRRAIQFAGLVLCCTALLPVGAPARVEVVNLVNGIGLIDYYDTEHYRVMRDFVANPQRMLKVLFSS